MMPTQLQSEPLSENPPSRLGPGRVILLWVLFFLICFGLGYPTLNRYDPRACGAVDSAAYYEIVVHGPTADLGYMQFRVLVPFLAKPFYWGRGRVGTWDPVFFGLLMANSLLVATTAFLLVRIGHLWVKNLAVGLLGATIYLLNFNVPNLRLAGLVDAGEGCFLVFLVWALFENHWWLLPIAGVLGALTKESFGPYSAVFVSTWWLVSSRSHLSRFSRAACAVAMVAAELVALMSLQASLTGHLLWPWQFAATLGGMKGYGRRFVLLLADRQSWYNFVWLLPLGVWRLKRLPRPWVVACATTVLCPLVLSAYHDVQPGTWGSAAFSIAGPLLSLSVALFLSAPTQSVMLTEI